MKKFIEFPMNVKCLLNGREFHSLIKYHASSENVLRSSSFGKPDNSLFLTEQCLNTESIIKAFLSYLCVST